VVAIETWSFLSSPHWDGKAAESLAIAVRATDQDLVEPEIFISPPTWGFPV
jgi:hypothetical protein